MSAPNKPVSLSSVEEEVFVYALLKQMGCTGEEATAFTKIILKMLSEPVLDRMELSSTRVEDQLKALKDVLEVQLKAQKDTQKESLNAQKESLNAQKEVLDKRLESQDAKYNQMRWFIGIGVAVLVAAGVFNVLTTLFGWGAG